MSTMREMQDSFAMAVHGMTITEAHEKGICVMCREDVKGNWQEMIPTPESQREFAISGLCDKCFDISVGR